MMSSARTFGFIETGGKEGDFLSDNLFGMEDWGVSSTKAEATNLNKLWCDDPFNHDTLNSKDCFRCFVLQGSGVNKFNFNETSSNSGESLSPDLFDIWLNGDNEYKLPDGIVIKQEPQSPISSSSVPSSPEHELIQDDFLMTIDQISQQPCQQPKQQPLLPPQQQQQLVTVSTDSNLFPTDIVSSINSESAVKSQPITVGSVDTALLNGTLTASPLVIKTEPGQKSSCNLSNSKVITEVLNSSQIVNGNNLRPLKPIIKIEPGKLLIATKPVTTVGSTNGITSGPTVTPAKVLVTNAPNTAKVKPEPVTTVKTEQPPTDESELKAWKRQQRMIKNRESASLSRKRKKEHLQSLESHIKQLLSQNSQLRLENENLRKRVKTLESENGGLKQTPMEIGSVAKKASCLLAVLLFLGLNMGPFNLIPRKRIESEHREIPVFRGRSLLQYSEKKLDSDYLTYTNTAYGTDKMKIPKQAFIPSSSKSSEMQNVINRLSGGIHNESVSRKRKERRERKKEKLKKPRKAVVEEVEPDVIGCPTSFNKTEVSRLNQALVGLVKRIKKDQVNKNRKTKKAKRRPKIPKKLPPIKTMLKPDINCTDEEVPSRTTSTSRVSRFTRRPLNSNARNHEIQLFHRGYSILRDFQKSIQRQDDTFYVVSFKRDHLILPALYYNDTQRPKVSFMIPASSLNESSWKVPPDSVPMMQIDCQVMDTKIVNVPRSNIPPQFIEKSRSTR